MTRRDSEPLIPPAKAHTVPLPSKPRPVTAEAEEAAAPPARAPVETEQMQTSHKPLDAVDREIADEADRLLEGGVSADSPAEDEQVPQVQAGAATDALIPASADQVASSEGMRIKGALDDDDSPLTAANDAENPQQEAHMIQPEADSPAQPDAKSESLATDSQPESQTERRPESAPAGAPPAAGSEAEAQAADKSRRPSWLSRAARCPVAAVVGVLVVINYPMRMLPEPARTIFNWFAASLLLWVPAIWFIALYAI